MWLNGGLDLPPSGNRISLLFVPVLRNREQAVGGTQHIYFGPIYGRKAKDVGPGARYPRTGLLSLGSTSPSQDMKLLENSSFEAINSQLTVETGDAHIIGR